MRIMKTLKFFLVVLGLGIGCFGAMAEEVPAKVAPGTVDSEDHFYAFGPKGNRSSGSDDSIQVVFVRVPLGAVGEVTLYVSDPASGSSLERGSSFFGKAGDTTFTVYGGRGAFTAGASQSVRPGKSQPGKALAKLAVGEEPASMAKRTPWAAFGPLALADGEQVGGYAYFKLVAEVSSGSGANFFKVGASAAAAEVFIFDLTMHLVRNIGDEMHFYVDVPNGVATVLESNFDYDTGAIPFFVERPTVASSTGRWRENTIRLNAGEAGRRCHYLLRKGRQGYGNGGFHFTDGKGVPLKVFFEDAPAAPGMDCSVAKSLLVDLQKCIPKQAVLGEDICMQLTLTAKADAGNVVVNDTLEPGLKHVRSEPAAQVVGQNLTWKFAKMSAGEQHEIKVWCTPVALGQVRNCATVRADPAMCVTTFAGAPALKIAKSGPAQALIRSNVAYSVVVQNTGTAVARDVVVTDTVPDGFEHASGERVLTYKLGNMEAKAQREIAVVLKATKRGRFCNVASAASINAGNVTAEACTLVVARLLEIAKSGTKTQFLGKRADYEIVVTNPGDVTLNNLVVTDQAPAGTRILAAPGATIAGNTATWRLASLASGQRKTFELTLSSRQHGTLCNSVGVASAEGLQATSQACTLWRGHPALLLEVVDTVDPLIPGETTEYIIRITNQGTADDTNVKIVARFPAEVGPVSASGSTATEIEGPVVTVTAHPVLGPKEAVEWRVKARGIKEGDSRLKVFMSSDLLKTPVTEEESTHVY